MERNSYPTLERFEIAHRELTRPHDGPMPEAKNRPVDEFVARRAVVSSISKQPHALEICSVAASLAA
jgi:hypothetical protein